MDNLQKSIELAFEEINQFQDKDDQIVFDTDQIIIGPNGILDSLLTANFLLELENSYSQITGKKIDFADLIIGDDGLETDFKFNDLKKLLDNEK